PNLVGPESGVVIDGLDLLDVREHRSSRLRLTCHYAPNPIDHDLPPEDEKRCANRRSANMIAQPLGRSLRTEPTVNAVVHAVIDRTEKFAGAGRQFLVNRLQPPSRADPSQRQTSPSASRKARTMPASPRTGRHASSSRAPHPRAIALARKCIELYLSDRLV